MKKSSPQKAIKQREIRLFRKFKAVPLHVLGLLSLSCLIFFFSLQKKFFEEPPFFAVKKIVSDMSAAWFQKGEKIRLFFTEKNELLQRNEQLQAQLLRYEQKFFEYASLKKENHYFKKILPVVEAQHLETVTVLQRQSPLHPYTFLTYPSADVCRKIQIGNLVLSTQGLVGRVVDKKNNTILILQASHIQSRLPVFSRQSHRKALLCGQNSALFVLKYSQKEEKITTDPFIADETEEADWVEGELLDFWSANSALQIPVARIVRKNGKVFAKGVATSRSDYITVILDNP
ncbi:hypothetical protein AGMMS49949_06250 [Alphaproteobacteria bacterium]|nr:hypothetical protein AGMMS49949_06250 [Alphaproteobacteria bacterium]GHS98170.1 hypothetical protein AGMMS50296_5680 [Alphaproteobacteria bacterium]